MRECKVQKTVSRGIAIAPVYVVHEPDFHPDQRTITADEVKEEIARFDDAVAKVQSDLTALAADNEIFAGHSVLAADVTIRDGVTRRIREGHQNAQSALMDTRDEYLAVFADMEDVYMKERAADLEDVCRRLLDALKGVKEDPFAAMKERSIIVARDLFPSDIAGMDPKRIAGLITEEGGVTSHLSILAKERGIPCLVGAGPFLAEVKTGELSILDAGDGRFFLDPDEKTISLYREKEKEEEGAREEKKRQSALPSLTRDGHAFRILVNAADPEDVRRALDAPMEGVGLYRPEFLYMQKQDFPTEEEQFSAYKEAAVLLDGKVLTIRTLDIGGDKRLDYCDFPEEDNPYLGTRAIRFCLERPEIFKTQLRAILRASAFGKVRILYPMIASLRELRKADALLKECKAELKSEGSAFDENIPRGILVETPAAVLMADAFANEADFFSIGSNDLTQYIMAADRGNRRLTSLYDPCNPAVLRAIAYTIETAHRHNVKVGLCGDLASDERAAGLLLGLGLDEFSMPGVSTAAVKSRLRDASYDEWKEKAQEILQQPTLEDVMKLL